MKERWAAEWVGEVLGVSGGREGRSLGGFSITHTARSARKAVAADQQIGLSEGIQQIRQRPHNPTRKAFKAGGILYIRISDSSLVSVHQAGQGGVLSELS